MSTGSDDDGRPVVQPTTKVTVAFPFSRISNHEPDELVQALADLMARTAGLVAELSDEPAAARLLEDAERLAARVREERS
jgi:hypothetical protein